MSEATCALQLTRRYHVPPAEVWRALTEPASRTRWLGAVPAEWRTLRDGEVLQLVLDDSVATIELRPDGGGTVLVLEHAGIPAPTGMRAMRLWTEALAAFEEQL